MSRSRRPSRRPTPAELRILADARARALADLRDRQDRDDAMMAALNAERDR